MSEAPTFPISRRRFLGTSAALERTLAEVSAMGADTRLDARYRKWRAMGNVGLAES